MARNVALAPLTGFFTATLIASILLDVKIITIFGTIFPAGILVFPLAYVFGDVLTEVYGYAASRRVVWTGFAAVIVTVGLFEIAKILPHPEFWENQAAFEALFKYTPRIVLGSLTAYLCGEFVNAFVLAKMKVKLKGKKMWWRFVASTLVGEGVDTVVFCAVAFVGTMPGDVLLTMALSAWIGKVIWEIVALPISLSLANWLKKIENEDHFDKKTNFNPFSLAE